MRDALSLDYAVAIQLALLIYALDDQVAQPAATGNIAAHWGANHETHHPNLTARDDPYHHVITGDIRSPDQTAPTIAHILTWVKGL